MRSADPTRLTDGERLAELADLLATGYQRHVASKIKSIRKTENPQVRLDVTGQLEAPCGSQALNPKSQEPEA